jgi:hypothetical protein
MEPNSPLGKRIGPAVSSYKRLDQLLVRLFGLADSILLRWVVRVVGEAPRNANDRIYRGRFPALYRLNRFSQLVRPKRQLDLILADLRAREMAIQKFGTVYLSVKVSITQGFRYRLLDHFGGDPSH